MTTYKEAVKYKGKIIGYKIVDKSGKLAVDTGSYSKTPRKSSSGGSSNNVVGTIKYTKGGKTINIPDTPEQRKSFERKGYSETGSITKAIKQETKIKSLANVQSKAELERITGSIGRRDWRKVKKELIEKPAKTLHSKIKSGKEQVWTDPEGKTYITRVSAPFGMRPEVAKQRGFTRIKPEEIVEKEGKLFILPKSRIKSGKATPEDVVGALTGAVRLGKGETKDYSEKEYLGYTILKKREEEVRPTTKKIEYERSPEYAIKVGQMAFAEMKKKGTLEKVKGLVASGMRPWSIEVAGMQLAESLNQVKKGSAERLLQQRLGEEILQTKREGITTMGFIRRLAEAPASVIGAPVTMAGLGSAFTGIRGALAGHSVRMKNLFDISMSGVGGWWLGSRAGEMAVAEFKQKDRPKLCSLALLTSAEIGGLGLGAGLVTASVKGKSTTLRTKPKGLTKRDIKTTTSKDAKGRVTKVTKKGNIDINVELPSGKITKVKGHFKATKTNGKYKGYVRVPRQTVEGVRVNPQKMVLRYIDPYYREPILRPKGEEVFWKPDKVTRFREPLRPKEPEPPTTEVDNLYRKTVSRVNEQSRYLEPKIPRELAKPKLKPKPETGLTKIERWRKQELMKRKVSPLKKISTKLLVVRRPPTIPIQRPVTSLININKNYLEIQKGMTDIIDKIEPYKIEPYKRPPKPKPPDPKIKKPSKPSKSKPPEKVKGGFPLFPIFGSPFGIGLGYNIDSQYRTMTKHLKHKIPTIEEILGM